ncbi:MAG: PDZ domain-containing protein [Isosphaeraceae bacterium]
MTRLVWRLGSALAVSALAVTAALALDRQAVAQSPPRDPQIGRSFQVPYRLTDTNHFLVRVRINGKGPFNFLVDSGAPALFVATETAKKVGLKPPRDRFWTPVDRLDIEGGSRLSNVKARVEDPFQLVGMNALGLPGASIDGILGFTILARYRLEIDPTQDRMVWTRLDNEPRDPPVPRRPAGEDQRNPAGGGAMNALGPLAKGLAFLMGKQPEEERHPHGFLGLEWAASAAKEPGRAGLRVGLVLEGSPAAKAGLIAGDRVLRIDGRAVDSPKAVVAALAELQEGDKVTLLVRRGSGSDARELKLVLTAGEGL